MNKMVKRACINAFAVKSRMDNVVPAQDYDATPMVEEILKDLLVMDFKTYADIARESTSERSFNQAYVQWREMVAYNSSVFKSVMLWAVKVSPEAAAKQHSKPIWDMVDLEQLTKELLPYVKSSYPMPMLGELILHNTVRRDLHMMVMMHAADSIYLNEEYISKVVAEAYGFESVEELIEADITPDQPSLKEELDPPPSEITLDRETCPEIWEDLFKIYDQDQEKNSKPSK